MASVEDAARITDSFLAEHAPPLPVPVTVTGMVDLFGGGKAGVSALARELADVRGIKYESARRNIERYTTERGAERRTPKRLLGDLNAIAERRASVVNVERITEQARELGGVVFRVAGYVRISKDERYRDFTVSVTAEAMQPFIEATQGRRWYDAGNELNYALLQAWDEQRGIITGNGGVITDIDDFDVGYGTEI